MNTKRTAVRVLAALTLSGMFTLGSQAQQPTGAGAKQMTPAMPASTSPSASSPAPLQPSAPSAAATDESRGLLLFQRFEGTSSAQGLIMQWITSTGYNFNRHFSMDLALPLYMLKPSPSALGAGATGGTGLGDMSLDARLNFDNHIANYGTTLTVTGPTGNKGMGLTAHRVTWDWSSDLSRDIWRFTPFLDAGVGDSIANFTPINQRTTQFKRPFTSVGSAAHFEAGTQFRIWKSLTFSASAYDIAPWGQQTVISRFLRPKSVGSVSTRDRRVFESVPVVVGTSGITRDNGYSSSLSLNPMSFVSISLGYTRSVPLHLDTLTWGVTFDVANMWKRARAQSASLRSDSQVQQSAVFAPGTRVQASTF